MAQQPHHEDQHGLSEETVTCAEELPHSDLQDYIYDCARKLFIESPGLSYHIVVVANTVEQHAELLLAKGMEFEAVKITGVSIPVRKVRRDMMTGSSSTRPASREAMEMLLLECKRLLSEWEPTRDELELYESVPGSPGLRLLRMQILANARKCFPAIVEEFTTGLATQVVIERDHRYRPISRQVTLTIPKSKIFNIAIVRGPNNSLQAALVYGQPSDLKFALSGEGKETYYGAISALLDATMQRLYDSGEHGHALFSVPISKPTSKMGNEAARVDSPMLETPFT